MKYFYEGQWQEVPGALTPVVDNLDSEDTKSALSAKQGKILNEKIEGMQVEETDPTVPSYVKNIQESDITKWNNKAEVSAIPTDLGDLTNSAGYLKTETDPTVPSHVKEISTQNIANWNAKSDFDGDYESLSNKPTKLSQFDNDSGFILNTVSNLANYYTKTDTYSKTEVNGLLANIHTLDVEVITDFPGSPSTTTIYLKKKDTGSEDQNIYDEYIYFNQVWEKIGDTKVDLTNYYNKSEVDAKVNAKANQTDLTSHTGDETRHVSAALKAKWDAKSDFDGDYNSLDNKPTIPTVGTLKTDNTAAQAASASESLSGAINLHKVAKTGNYEDLNNKPVIPSKLTDAEIAAMGYVKFEKADSEEDAKTKSAQNPNVVYYWV